MNKGRKREGKYKKNGDNLVDWWPTCAQNFYMVVLLVKFCYRAIGSVSLVAAQVSTEKRPAADYINQPDPQPSSTQAQFTVDQKVLCLKLDLTLLHYTKASQFFFVFRFCFLLSYFYFSTIYFKHEC